MKKKPFHHLPDGTFRNPEGSPQLSFPGNWSFSTFNKEKRKLDMTVPKEHVLDKKKVLSDLERYKDDINNTVIKGTPLQNSIKPTEIYLTVGNTDLLPKAKNIPTGKQKIKQKKETIKVNDNPPHAPVSTQTSPNDPPEIK